MIYLIITAFAVFIGYVIAELILQLFSLFNYVISVEKHKSCAAVFVVNLMILSRNDVLHQFFLFHLWNTESVYSQTQAIWNFDSDI